MVCVNAMYIALSLGVSVRLYASIMLFIAVLQRLCVSILPFSYQVIHSIPC